MRYYVFHVKIEGKETTIVCERFIKCPLIQNHILCIGVVNVNETCMDGLKVDRISIKTTNISYYTHCTQNILSSPDLEEKTNIH